MAVVCTSQQIEMWCKQSPPCLYRKGYKPAEAAPIEQPKPAWKATLRQDAQVSGPSLNNSDLPEVWIASNDHRSKSVRHYSFNPKKFSKGYRRNLRTRAGPGSKIGAVPEDEEEFFSEEDAHAQGSESDEKSCGSWICTQCTFENHALLPHCEMCSAPASCAGTKRTVRAEPLVPQDLPEDRTSASAWPSLAQAGHRGEEEWDTLSTTCFMNAADLMDALENREDKDDDEVSSVMSFMNVAEAVVKHAESDDDDTKSLASDASFLMVHSSLENKIDTSAGSASGPTTTWAARIAAAAARAPPATASTSGPCLRPAQQPIISSHKKDKPKVKNHCDEDEDEDEDMTWGRRGHVHKGRQWQKHRRRVELSQA